MDQKRRMERGWAVLAAVCALVLQVAVGATPVQASTVIEVCTAHGSKIVVVDAANAPGQPNQGPCPHCDHCLAAAQPAPATAPMLVAPVRYGQILTHAAQRPRTLAVARGPPRPFGQGPPTFLNS